MAQNNSNNITPPDPVKFNLEDRIPDDEAMKVLNRLQRSIGMGSMNHQYYDFMNGLDRFQHNMLPPNIEHSGYTFITRPTLRLDTHALRMRPEFTPLLNTDPSSTTAAIRCYLDPAYHRKAASSGNGSLMANVRSPFLTPVCNGLTSLSGWPDITLQTLTTDSGFHMEDQTFVVGYDMLTRSYDINMTFKDIQGGPLAALFFFWVLNMGYVANGEMPIYENDEDELRMNYTVSIYRFIVDPTKQIITKFSRGVGCFPKNLSIGAMFNFNESEVINTDVGTFSIPFTVNGIEYNNYKTLVDFNLYIQRCLNIDKGTIDAAANLPLMGDNNYVGIPWVDTSSGEIRLVYK